MLENANPTVYNVSNAGGARDKEFYSKLVASKAISRYAFDPKGINPLDVSSIPTPIERSVHLAIQSIDKERGNGKEDGISVASI